MLIKTAGKERKGFTSRVGHGIDRLIGIFNPRLEYQRNAFRKANAALGSYKGARRTRLNENWISSTGSADADLLSDLPLLRERSRDLVRNDAHAAGIISTVTSNTIGTGIVPQCRVDEESVGINQDAAAEYRQLTEKVWERWFPFADAQERMDFYEIQNLVDRQILESGEAIVMPLMLPTNEYRPYSLAFDVIEPDRLASPAGTFGDPTIRGGVKLGERGQPIGYYIRETHPGDTAGRSSEFRFIPARNSAGRQNLIHLYPVLRPGQSRGVPFFAPAMDYFKQLADYMESELVAARIAACFAIFIKKTDAYGSAQGATSETTADGDQLEDMHPGMIERLAIGEEPVSLNPSRPGAQFDPFVNRILRAICASLNLPYELVSKDFSQTNYSSARAALIEARRYFKTRQLWLTRKLCQPTWNMLMEEAYLRGELPANNFYEKQSDWCRVKWLTPGWQWVDPVKEAQSAELAVEMGVSSLADENAAQGKDWQDTMEQRARELKHQQELEKKHGIKFPVKTSGKQPPTEEPEPQPALKEKVNEKD